MRIGDEQLVVSARHVQFDLHAAYFQDIVRVVARAGAHRPVRRLINQVADGRNVAAFPFIDFRTHQMLDHGGLVFAVAGVAGDHLAGLEYRFDQFVVDFVKTFFVARHDFRAR